MSFEKFSLYWAFKIQPNDLGRFYLQNLIFESVYLNLIYMNLKNICSSISYDMMSHRYVFKLHSYMFSYLETQSLNK